MTYAYCTYHDDKQYYLPACSTSTRCYDTRDAKCAALLDLYRSGSWELQCYAVPGIEIVPGVQYYR